MPYLETAMTAAAALQQLPGLTKLFKKDKKARLGVDPRTGKVGSIKYGNDFSDNERGTSPQDYFTWLMAKQAGEAQANNAPLLEGLSRMYQSRMAQPGGFQPTSFNPYGRQPSIPAFANGGIVTRPTIGLIGEAGPEAIVPLSPRSTSNPLFSTPAANNTYDNGFLSPDQGGRGGRDLDKQFAMDRTIGRQVSLPGGGGTGVGGTGVNPFTPPLNGGGSSMGIGQPPPGNPLLGGGSYGVQPVDRPAPGYTVGDAQIQQQQQQQNQGLTPAIPDYGPGALPDYGEMAGFIPGAQTFAGANPNGQRGYSDELFKRMSDRIIATANENAAARGAFGGSANQQSIFEGLTPLALASERFGQDLNNDAFNQALQTFGINSGQRQQEFTNRTGLQDQYFGQGQQINQMNNQMNAQQLQQLLQYLGMSGPSGNPLFN